jgi:hypothetical protein
MPRPLSRVFEPNSPPVTEMRVFVFAGMTPKNAQINGRGRGFFAVDCLASPHLGIVPETVAPWTDQISRSGECRREKLSKLSIRAGWKNVSMREKVYIPSPR